NGRQHNTNKKNPKNNQLCDRAQKIIEKIGKSKFIKANIRSSNLELLSKTTWETFLLEFNKAVETDDDNNGDGDIDMELDE
ncbi:15763_t:CDS:1, partial [Entrophospora sp. SA101]